MQSPDVATEVPYQGFSKGLPAGVTVTDPPLAALPKVQEGVHIDDDKQDTADGSEMESLQPNGPERELSPDIAELSRTLKKHVQGLQEEEKNRTYKWLEDCNMNIWEFGNKNQDLMRNLEDELDISDWDDVAADLGLTYQQIERCRRCHSGRFMKQVFATLEECHQHQDLTMRRLLEVLFQRKHRGILFRIEKYGRLGPESSIVKTFNQNIQRQPEVLVQASNIGRTDRGTKVLIIHAHDTKEDALLLASQLRNPEGKRRLSVLLLQESNNTKVNYFLSVDPWNVIPKWFLSVDVVVPVLSPLFLRQIQNRDIGNERAWEKRYNRYIYRMMLDQYVEHGSRNYCCRAVCPARFQGEVTNNDLYKHSGLLKEVWNCSSEVQVRKYAQILYNSAKEYRKIKKRWKEELEQMKCENELAEEWS